MVYVQTQQAENLRLEEETNDALEGEGEEDVAVDEAAAQLHRELAKATEEVSRKRKAEEETFVPAKRGRGRPRGSHGINLKDHQVRRDVGTQHLICVQRASSSRTPNGGKKGMHTTLREIANHVYGTILDEAVPRVCRLIAWVGVPATAEKVQGDSHQRKHPNEISFRRSLLMSPRDGTTILMCGSDGISVVPTYWWDIRRLTRGHVRIVICHSQKNQIPSGASAMDAGKRYSIFSLDDILVGNSIRAKELLAIWIEALHDRKEMGLAHTSFCVGSNTNGRNSGLKT